QSGHLATGRFFRRWLPGMVIGSGQSVDNNVRVRAILSPMNRLDRLMAMVLRLQGRRVVRAEDLATHFEISVRTVYRDIAALGEAGIPVMGEAGVGYGLAKGYHLPPVMFTAEEASALFMGGKLVDYLTDASLRKQMDSALLK